MVDWYSFQGKLTSGAKTIVEELEARPEIQRMLKQDTNEGFRTVFDMAVEKIKSRKGLTEEVERKLARNQWDSESLKMGKEGGVCEAEVWLGLMGRPRAMMLRTGLQRVGDAALEATE